jgi:hypothetical protein
MKKSTKHCRGCRNDFYNGRENITGNDCWSLKTAKVVKRWKLGWWTEPKSKEAFTKVATYDCHSAPGQYALYERLPRHLGGERA